MTGIELIEGWTIISQSELPMTSIIIAFILEFSNGM